MEKMTRLEQKNKTYELKIETLEGKVEHLERNSRASSIEIRNIARQPSENKAVLSSLIKVVGEVVQHPISDPDIQDIYHLRTKNEANNHIVVKFSNFVL